VLSLQCPSAVEARSRSSSRVAAVVGQPVLSGLHYHLGVNVDLVVLGLGVGDSLEKGAYGVVLTIGT